MNESAPFWFPSFPFLPSFSQVCRQNKSGEMRPSVSMMDLFRPAAIAVNRATRM